MEKIYKSAGLAVFFTLMGYGIGMAIGLDPKIVAGAVTIAAIAALSFFSDTETFAAVLSIAGGIIAVAAGLLISYDVPGAFIAGTIAVVFTFGVGEEGAKSATNAEQSCRKVLTVYFAAEAIICVATYLHLRDSL